MGLLEDGRAIIDGAGAWRNDWIWGLLMIFITVVIHITGLGLMHAKAVRVFFRIRNHRYTGIKFVLVLGAVTMMTTLLHMLEIIIWALGFLALGAIPNVRSGMLYSLNAMTSYGHESLSLNPQWQLLGATEALNGWLLFGLTTAFLFSMFQRALHSTERQID